MEMGLRNVRALTTAVEELDGLETIENVHYTSPNQELSRMALYLLNTFFAEEGEDW